MTGELIQIIQGLGNDANEAANYIRAGQALYQFGGQTIGALKTFFGKKQEENIKAISEKVEDKLRDVPEEQIEPPSPSVAEPLIEAAMQESRPELQDMWAGLLASAMIKGNGVRYQFKETLERMNPTDALVLKIVAEIPNDQWTDMTKEANQSHLMERKYSASISEDEWGVSIKSLNNLGCISPNSVAYQRVIPGPSNLAYPLVTPYGRLFLKAVTI